MTFALEQFIDYTDHIFVNESLSSTVNWRVKKRPVYRLLDDKQWLNNFFSSGEIALSCLSNFRNYPDEIKGDKEEGDAMIYFEDDSEGTVGFKYEAGLNAYIFCTTLELNNKVIKDFNAIGAIKIHNATYFGAEISTHIEGCKQGIEGQCIYEDNRVYEGYSPKINQMLSSEDYLNDALFRSELNIATSERELFLKSEKYKSQKEHRILWLIDNPVNSNMIVKCPEAIRFCERIDF